MYNNFNQIVQKRTTNSLLEMYGVSGKDPILVKGGKPASIGETREWKGKNYRKEGSGKWLEISEFGSTHKEHKTLSEQELPNDLKREGWTKESLSNLHKEQASGLSDKEHSDEEVGLGGEVKQNYNEGSHVAFSIDGTNKSGTIVKVVKANDGSFRYRIKDSRGTEHSVGDGDIANSPSKS